LAASGPSAVGGSVDPHTGLQRKLRLARVLGDVDWSLRSKVVCRAETACRPAASPKPTGATPQPDESCWSSAPVGGVTATLGHPCCGPLDRGGWLLEPPARPELTMTLPRTVAEILADHVDFEVECIDRMYLNVYVPSLQYAAGIVGYVHQRLGLPIASTAALAIRRRDSPIRAQPADSVGGLR
jgi:hypothetical protein